MKGPKKATLKSPKEGAKSKRVSEGNSDIRKACMYITKAVHAGVLGAAIATKAMALMNCGGRSDLGDKAYVDKGHGDGTVDAGTGGCMGVDAGDGCMGVDAGDGCMGIDAGDGCMGVDAGGSMN